jgi:CubicO group peptidase (beta-lactamase class C family)
MDLTIGSPEEVGMSSARLARIKPAMQALVDRHGFAGISTLVARRGRVVHFEQVGWQERESRTPMAPGTIFRIASMTKPVTAVAVVTLYEEGRFQLSTPVAQFLPAFAKMRVLSVTRRLGCTRRRRCARSRSAIC